jgi:hypothetical protein
VQEIRVIKEELQQDLLIDGETSVEFITDLPFTAYLAYRGFLRTQDQALQLRLKKNRYHTVSLLLENKESVKLKNSGTFFLELRKGETVWKSKSGRYEGLRTGRMAKGGLSVEAQSVFPPLTVNEKLRTVSIPGGNLQIGVERDHNARRVWFTCPRFYDGHDMSECGRHYIFYQHWPEKCFDETVIGQYQIEDVAVSVEDESVIEFSWLISQNVTLHPGQIAFVLCFKDVDEDGKTIWEWHTRRTTGLSVGEGIEETDKIEELYPDLLEQWLSKMEGYDVEVKQVQKVGEYAKTQGDYAKAQGDRAKSEADRLEGVDAAALQEQLDALPGKYVQLTNLTKLTKEGLRMEDFSPGNYFALGEVANSLEDKPEGVQLAQAFVTMYWDYGTTGNTTKRIELLERVNGRKWFKSYNGTTWGSWFEYARKTDVEPYTKLKEYTTWTDLGLKEGEATIEQLFNAMSDNSIAVLTKTSTTPQGEFPYQWGMLTVVKSGRNRSSWEYSLNNAGNVVRRWVGGYSEGMEPKWTGWKEITFEENIADKTKMTQYTTWTDLGLKEGEATTEEIFKAMRDKSLAVLRKTSGTAQSDLPFGWGLLIVYKWDYTKGYAQFTNYSRNADGMWIGYYDDSITDRPKFSGWRKLSVEGHNHNGFEPIDVTGKTLDIHSLTSQTPGIEWYRCRTSAGAANITNIPVAGQPFFLEKKAIRVGSANGTDLVINFRFLSSSAKKEYECWCTVSSTGIATWTEWKERP